MESPGRAAVGVGVLGDPSLWVGSESLFEEVRLGQEEVAGFQQQQSHIVPSSFPFCHSASCAEILDLQCPGDTVGEDSDLLYDVD